MRLRQTKYLELQLANEDKASPGYQRTFMESWSAREIGGVLKKFNAHQADVEKAKQAAAPKPKPKVVPPSQSRTERLKEAVLPKASSVTPKPKGPLTEEEKTGQKDRVISVSRERYASGRDEVSEKIMKWHNAEEEAAMPRIMAVPIPASQAGTAPAPEQAAKIATSQSYAAPAPKSESSVYLYDAVCARCGKDTKVSFKPDGVRPVFCKECLSILREEKAREATDRKRMKQEELQNLQAAPIVAPDFASA
jgi:CxxC-x17-CxxC domain-containing protein